MGRRCLSAPVEGSGEGSALLRKFSKKKFKMASFAAV